MRQIIYRIKWLGCRIFTAFANTFIRRNKDIWLFGSWMGYKFSDNTRFLYQFLYMHQEEYGLEKLIWVTRSKSIYRELCSLGYEAYMMHSLRSIYYHLKAGVHIVCNGTISIPGFKGDIIGELSGNSVKIQLWHGIGVKKVNRAITNSKNKSNKIKNYMSIKAQQLSRSINPWSNCFWLAASVKEEAWIKRCFDVRTEFIIQAVSPRNCACICMLSMEKEVIEKLKKYPMVILYLPTFRDKYCHYKHPLKGGEILEFLEAKNILWVEKLHSAATGIESEHMNSDHVLYLDDVFDINTIIKESDVLVTDYSTVIYDFILHNKCVEIYIPDYEYYLNEDRGFLIDFKTYFPCGKTMDPQNLLRNLVMDLTCGLSEEVRQRYDEINREKWENKELDINITVRKILETLS